MSDWFVKPVAAGSANGTSEANAWGGWSSIVWGVGGVVGGDTLYVLGAHEYASAITIGAHGGTSLATRCTISGAYPGIPGSIRFTTNGDFLQNDRAWTRITGLTITAADTGASNNNCIFHTGTADNCWYDGNTLNGATTAVSFSFYGEDGHNHLNVEITDNEFVGGGGQNGGAIGWFVTTTDATSTLTNITVARNRIRDVTNNNNGVIQFRTEADVNVASVMRDIYIEDNVISNTKGVVLRLYHGHASLAPGGALYVNRNSISNAAYSDLALGGAIHPRGFSSGVIARNIIREVAGDAGAIDFQYCTNLLIIANDIDGVDTDNIDGNGILFDAPGSNNCRVIGNTIRNCRGKAGVFNSGVGIMFLEGTNNVAMGNVVVGCVHGIHIGAQDGGQSCGAYLNTLVDISGYAVSTVATADLANCSVKQNVFVGEGYSVYDQTGVAWTGEDYNCFYGFSSGTLNHTLGSSGVVQDPILGLDFGLGADSPCRNAGIQIPGITLFGFDGKQILKERPDIGAHQYYEDRTVVSRRALVGVSGG